MNLLTKGSENHCKNQLRKNLKEHVFDIKETIKGFNMIMNGEVDQYPEAAFNLVGSIEEAIEKGEKMIAEAK